jgi:hypothetical protein
MLVRAAHASATVGHQPRRVPVVRANSRGSGLRRYNNVAVGAAHLPSVSGRWRRQQGESADGHPALVLARESRLMDIHGVGAVVAARILADVGDAARFADQNRFASWTGTAPLDASSGEQNRHRLSRAGNRRVNHMIHIAAVTQLRPGHRGQRLLPTTQASSRQEAEGSASLPQATDLRRHLQTACRRSPTCRGGSGRALRGVSRIQRGRPAPAYRHFGSATSRTRETDATSANPSLEEPAADTARHPPHNRREPV